jgi:integral membrane protein
MAYVTAVMLLVLSTCMIFKYGFDRGDDLTLVVSQVHGLLFMVYLVFAFDLGHKARWPFGKLLWVLVSGTIPFVAFAVERRITAEIRPLVRDGDEDADEDAADAVDGARTGAVQA